MKKEKRLEKVMKALDIEGEADVFAIAVQNSDTHSLVMGNPAEIMNGILSTIHQNKKLSLLFLMAHEKLADEIENDMRLTSPDEKMLKKLMSVLARGDGQND